MKTNNIKFKWIYAVSTVIFLMYGLTACSVNQAFQITSADVNRLQNQGYGYTASAKELETGSKLYVVKCGNCHNLIVPSKYTNSEWQLNYLERELAKAKVEKATEKKLITAFILAKSR